MTRILLSICIPTYNFAEFIGETLDSISNQSSDSVEVVVVDGASTDNTVEIVRKYQKVLPNLFLHVLERKGGIDHDMAQSITFARGKYCWLMSSDDVIRPIALERVLRELKTGEDIYLCNRIECDKGLSPVKERPWFSNRLGDHVFNLSTRSELLEYLNAAQSLGALFGFMSSIIVRREKWNGIADSEIFYGSNYAHVFRLFSIALHGGILKYIAEPLVLARGDNDSFLTKGIGQRYLIDFSGYKSIIHRLVSDSDVQNKFKLVMRREHKWYFLIGLRSKVKDLQEWEKLEDHLRYYNYGSLKILLIQTIGTSRTMMYLIKAFRNLLFRNPK